MMFTLLNNKTSVIILLVSNTCIDKFKSDYSKTANNNSNNKHKHNIHS